MKYSKEILEQWIDKINNEATRLTTWEMEFVESVEAQLKIMGKLSDRQVEILERIYTEKTP